MLTNLDGGMVYLALDSAGVTIYVGLSRAGTLDRVRDHERDYWWPECVWVQLITFPTYARAGYVEKALISYLRPRHNAKSNPDYHYRPAMPRGGALRLYPPAG